MAPRTLLRDSERRKQALERLLQRLEKGQHVQNRDIEKVLNPEQRERFRQEIADARRPLAEPVIPYPSELDRYLALVNRATLEYAKAERLKGKPSSHARYRAAEALFQRAEEALGETVDMADGMTLGAIEWWLDRPIARNEAGSIDIGLDPASVPRKRGSRSKYAHQVAALATSYDMIRRVKEGYLLMELQNQTGSAGSKPPSQPVLFDLQNIANLVRR